MVLHRTPFFFFVPGNGDTMKFSGVFFVFIWIKNRFFFCMSGPLSLTLTNFTFFFLLLLFLRLSRVQFYFFTAYSQFLDSSRRLPCILGRLPSEEGLTVQPVRGLASVEMTTYTTLGRHSY